MESADIYLSLPTEKNLKKFKENLNTKIGDFKKKNKDIPSTAVIYHGQTPLEDSNIIKYHLDDEEDKVAYYHIKRVSTENPLFETKKFDEEKTGYTKNPLLGSGMKIKLNKKYRKKRNNTKKRKSHKHKSHKRKSHKRKSHKRKSHKRRRR